LVCVGGIRAFWTLASATAVEAFLNVSRGAYSRWSDVGIAVRCRTKSAAVKWEAEILGLCGVVVWSGCVKLEKGLGCYKCSAYLL